MKLKISLGQMDIKLGEVSANMATVQEMTAEAAEGGSDLIVFPELWPTGYDLQRAAEYVTDTRSGVFSFMATLAKKYEIAISGSALSLLGNAAYGNTAVLIDPKGISLGEYSKTHLFRLMEEDHYLKAGDNLGVFDSPWGKVGLAICYDLRFPELFRAYALAGVHTVILPSEWPNPRKMHWQTLLRARAIENQIFLVACNRIGQSGDTSFFGHSSIIDPWGETIVEANEQADLISAEIDTSAVKLVRNKIPIFADRRPDVYEKGN
jgi:omega-amidase